MDEREVGRVARSAAESVYGVVAVVGSGWADRLADRLNFARTGVAVESRPELRVTVDLRVADGVPAGQVAANVAEKVRYVVERDLGKHIAHVTVRVDGHKVDLPKSAADSAAERPHE
jgi:uncharacterized alkaline shock family protein YloU